MKTGGGYGVSIAARDYPREPAGGARGDFFRASGHIQRASLNIRWRESQSKPSERSFLTRRGKPGPGGPVPVPDRLDWPGPIRTRTRSGASGGGEIPEIPERPEPAGLIPGPRVMDEWPECGPESYYGRQPLPLWQRPVLSDMDTLTRRTCLSVGLIARTGGNPPWAPPFRGAHALRRPDPDTPCHPKSGGTSPAPSVADVAV